jgi:hypothetical protein
VRPAPAAAAAVRVGGGAGAARGTAARGAGPRRAALDAAAAAAAVPVVGRGRAPRAHGWCARPTGCAGCAVGVGRSRTAALVARREAFDSELAALPAAVEWPNLKIL